MPLFSNQPTIESHGYNETLAGSDWARLAWGVGNQPVALYTNDWAPSIGTGVLQVTLSPGSVFGDGVEDILTAAWTGALPAVTTAGQQRWDTIYLQRDFGNNKTSIGYSLGTQSAAPVNNIVVPASTPLVKYAPLCMVRVDAGKTQVGAVESLRGYAANTMFGALRAARDKRDGAHVITPDGQQFVYVGGQPRRLYDPDTVWHASTSSFSSGASLSTTTLFIPIWKTATRGQSTFAPSTNGTKILLPPGTYSVEPYISTSGGRILFEVRANINAISSSFVPESSDPGGQLLTTIANAASRRITITQDTNITLIARTEPSSPAASLWTTGHMLDIFRVSDL